MNKGKCLYIIKQKSEMKGRKYTDGTGQDLGRKNNHTYL